MPTLVSMSLSIRHKSATYRAFVLNLAILPMNTISGRKLRQLGGWSGGKRRRLLVIPDLAGRVCPGVSGGGPGPSDSQEVGSQVPPFSSDHPVPRSGLFDEASLSLV